MARKAVGTGRGGKSFQDREFAAQVRNKAMEDVFKVLSDSPEVNKWSEYKKQMLLSLSKSILPRLNEHSGENGDPLKVEHTVVYIPKR